MHRRLMTALLIAFALVLTACGDDSSDTETSSDGTSSDETPSDAAADETTDPEELADDLAGELEETQNVEGGGSATLTVGDQEWVFDSVLCAIGEEETGQEDAEFVLSSIQDGTQFYISIDSFGHSVNFDDIENFEDPSVSLASIGEDFIVVDGKNVSGETEFADGTAEGFATVPGSFSGTCP